MTTVDSGEPHRAVDSVEKCVQDVAGSLDDLLRLVLRHEDRIADFDDQRDAFQAVAAAVGAKLDEVLETVASLAERVARLEPPGREGGGDR